MTTNNTQLGWAYLSASTQRFLDSCEAVICWLTSGNSKVAVFEFDPMVEVWTVPPGVHFNIDDAPSEVVELMS